MLGYIWHVFFNNSVIFVPVQYFKKMYWENLFSSSISGPQAEYLVARATFGNSSETFEP